MHFPDYRPTGVRGAQAPSIYQSVPDAGMWSQEEETSTRSIENIVKSVSKETDLTGYTKDGIREVFGEPHVTHMFTAPDGIEKELWNIRIKSYAINVIFVGDSVESYQYQKN